MKEEIKELAKIFAKKNIKVHQKRGLSQFLRDEDLYDLMTDFALSLNTHTVDNALVEAFCEKHAITPQTLIDVYEQTISDALNEFQSSVDKGVSGNRWNDIIGFKNSPEFERLTNELGVEYDQAVITAGKVFDYLEHPTPKPQEGISLSTLRSCLNLYDKEEITLSRFKEMLNESIGHPKPQEVDVITDNDGTLVYWEHNIYEYLRRNSQSHKEFRIAMQNDVDFIIHPINEDGETFDDKITNPVNKPQEVERVKECEHPYISLIYNDGVFYCEKCNKELE